MIAYITDIIVPYVERHRQALEDDVPALVIMDNFKGNIHVCLLPPNTTDLLQPMDIAVNKPAKDFLKRNFEEWGDYLQAHSANWRITFYPIASASSLRITLQYAYL